jgi:hypothetical protein
VSADLAALAALIDPAAEVAYRRQLGAEAWRDGWRRGYRHGYERGTRLLEAGWPAVVAPVLWNRPDHADLVVRRWHVCCRPCRLRGHQPGCAQCEDRDRDTFGGPHPGDRGRS